MADRPDLMRQIANAGARLDLELSDRDVERLVSGAFRRRRRKRIRNVAMAGGGLVVLAWALTGGIHRKAGPVAVQAPAKPETRPTPAADPVVRLADGSTATPLDTATEIGVVDQSAEHVGLVLRHGRGRFDVVPRPQRTFVVAVGDVSVTVLGTIFTVERVADRVGVTVEVGTVRIDWGVGSTTLGAGASGWYPPLVMRRVDSPAPIDRKPSRLVSVRPSRGESRPTIAAEKAESAEGLLAAADDARLAGHQDQGADLLRKLLRDYRDDVRAPLAAFTLGRMLLMELHRPLEAAAAFAEVRQLSPRGPLAEDALAREVEAFAQAGAPELARARAQEYLRFYPDGRRAAALKATVGLK